MIGWILKYHPRLTSRNNLTAEIKRRAPKIPPFQLIPRNMRYPDGPVTKEIGIECAIDDAESVKETLVETFRSSTLG